MTTLNELRNEFIKQLNEYEYDNEMIEKLSNDVHTLMFIEMQLNEKSEFLTICDLMSDVGFSEFLQMQFDTPITFDEMK